MKVLTIEGALAGKLRKVGELIELRDKKETLLGYFSPEGLGVPAHPNRPGAPRRGRPPGRSSPRLDSPEEVFEHILNTATTEARREEIRNILARLKE